MGYTFDQNVIAASFASRERRERTTFIILLVMLIIIIVAYLIGRRLIETRRKNLVASGAIIEST